ncbi:MAG: ABC transporter permease [Thermomicrobiales bacterium]|nr:ABC transporter permease [Thermomicrobiales bacterium]
MRYALTRLVLAVPIMFGVSLFTFLMLHFVPGDPVAAMFIGQGAAVSEEQMDKVRDELGLNDPLPVQYLNFLKNAVRGDLGNSIRTNEPVSEMIMRNLPATMQLTLASMAFALVLGISLGMLAAIKRGTVFDTAAMFIALLGVSMPSFWLGLLLISVFSIQLGWFPIIGGSGWRGLILPAFALGFAASAIIARMVRASLLDVLRDNYIVTARAKGLTERRVIFRHALRNAAIPVLTIVGLQFGGLLAGAVIIESVFTRQGLGRMLVTALQSRDFPVAQGGVLFVAIVYVFVNLIVDLFYGVIDPRISVD